MENKRVLKHVIWILFFMLLFAAAFFLITKDAYANDEPIDISTGKIVLSQNTYTYDGQAKYPDVTVIVNGEELSYWDYEVKYYKNTNAGTAKVVVTADDYYDTYTGKLTRTFTIKKRKLTKSRFSLSKQEFVYNGKVKKLHGTYNYTDGRDRYMKVGRDIKISSSKKLKKVGKYKITVRGTGNFTGKLKYTITIRPKNPKGVTLAKRTKKTFRVKWKKVKGATGYSVEYWNAKKGKYISKNRNKKKFFDVPVNADFTGDVIVYSYKKVNGKKIKSTGKYYYNGVKPRVKPKFGLRTDGRSFIVKMKRDGYYEMWTATNKKFTKDFKPFTFYRVKNGEFTIYGASTGEFYRYIKIRHYVPLKNGNKLYGPWSKIRKAIWY